VAGKETGRREEENGQVWEKSLEIRHSVVFSCPEEAELAPSSAAGVAQDGKDLEIRLPRRRLGVQLKAARKQIRSY
jgi:hypothetical protein